MTETLYRALDHHFVISGEIPSGWLSALAGLRSPAVHPVHTVYRVHREQSYYTVRERGVPIGHGDRDGALDSLVWHIRDRAVASQQVALHAAIVRQGATVVVLAGPSGSGKSTIATGLQRAGWMYLGDELVGLGTNSDLRPCVTPPRLTAHARQELGLLRPDEAPMKNDRKAYVALDMMSPAVPSVAGKVHIVLLAPSSSRETVLMPRSPLHTAAALTELVFAGAEPGEALDALTRLTRQARCFRLQTGPIAASVATVAALASDHA